MEDRNERTKALVWVSQRDQQSCQVRDKKRKELGNGDDTKIIHEHFFHPILSLTPFPPSPKKSHFFP